jgi:hypothetical protein
MSSSHISRHINASRAAFETTDSALRGEFTITTTLVDADSGTDVHVLSEGLPPGLPTADNETGTRMALAKRAALVEEG